MAKSKEQNEKIKDERRERILSVALRLFATNGLAGTKVADIAAAAEMSHGLLYHYYRAKEDIYVELIRHAFENMNSAALALEALPLPSREKIHLAIEKLLEGLESNEDTGHYHLLIAVATASDVIPDEAKRIIQENNQLPYAVMARIIQQGQLDGTVREGDPEQLALVFWTSIKGLCIHKAAHGSTFKAPSPELLMNLFI
ncbi:MAG: TetR/AcrR family transcriptional regulator [Caldilineaceae bacterium]|nr:TetR/AcrR family transcriptional regulator [Caldilineaceae bacterium]